MAFTISAANGLLNGATGNNLTATIASPPTHGTLGNVNSATGVFTYTPANNTYTGTDTFSYTVTDGIGTSAPATVTITINALPSAAAQSYSTDAGMAFTTSAANGLLKGATGNNLTAVIATQPAHGALGNVNGATGVFTYTPANNTYTGTDTFSYTVTDSIGTSLPATVTITINPLPTAAAQSYTTNSGIAFTTTAANGLLKGATGSNLTAAIATQPAHGTLSNVNGSTGVFTYTLSSPTYVGTDSFTYTVTDGIGTSAPATVTITILAYIVANNDSYGLTNYGSLAVPAPGVLGNDTTTGSLPLSAMLVSGMSHGQLTLNASGAFSYTPTPGFSGTDSFTYTATDGQAVSNTATVTLTVNYLNPIPVANPDSYATPENTTPERRYRVGQ